MARDDIKKFFQDVVSVSLNSDQAAAIAMEIDGQFNLYKASGFGSKIAIPTHAAAEAISHYFRKDEYLIQFFERMLLHEGKFLYDGTCRVFNKVEFIKLLESHKWIFDSDTGRFFRDSFFVDKLNFLKSIELIDLRKEDSVDHLVREITQKNEEMQLDDVPWDITVRMYRLKPEYTKLIEKLVWLLLRTHRREGQTSELFTCLKELVINASKATYKILFEKYVTSLSNIHAATNYQIFLDLFRKELDEHGDENVSRFAEAEDKYFDIQFKSAKNAVSCWSLNYFPISKVEKLQLIKKLNYTMYESNLMDFEDEELREGAGMGIGIARAILSRFTDDPHPLKPVFYPNCTKVGFYLKDTRT